MVSPSTLAPEVALATLDIPPTARTILRLLIQDFGRWVPLKRIIHEVWGGWDTGGPLDAPNVIAKHISLSHPVIRAAGYEVQATWNQRRLVRLA